MLHIIINHYCVLFLYSSIITYYCCTQVDEWSYILSFILFTIRIIIIACVMMMMFYYALSLLSFMHSACHWTLTPTLILDIVIIKYVLLFTIVCFGDDDGFIFIITFLLLSYVSITTSMVLRRRWFYYSLLVIIVSDVVVDIAILYTSTTYY